MENNQNTKWKSKWKYYINFEEIEGTPDIFSNGRRSQYLGKKGPYQFISKWNVTSRLQDLDFFLVTASLASPSLT